MCVKMAEFAKTVFCTIHVAVYVGTAALTVRQTLMIVLRVLVKMELLVWMV